MISVYALCTGYIELDRASMLSDLEPGQPWTVPVTSFLVDHPRGRLLFDTGVHCRARLDPVGRLGAERVKRLTVKSAEGDDEEGYRAQVARYPRLSHDEERHLLATEGRERDAANRRLIEHNPHDIFH